MPLLRIASKILHSAANQSCKHQHQHRTIFATTQLQGSWMEKVKNVITGQKTTQSQGDASEVNSDSFTLIRFADEMKKARRIGAFKEFMVGRSSEATFSSAFEKYEAIIRYLGVLDSTGENLQTAQKQEAAKHCGCTLADVENALAKFTWAKEAQKKIEKLKEEGKPTPKSFAEVQKLVGSTPLDLARSNLAKAGQISRNAPCPCGSKKRYKRCCGKD
ncbi:hypothetical protein PHAVU_006G097900 [Phaseolus vulgaris]|uniref:Uncharacterized protein n=1 Tax=Phaseolus vulgaris TaxID=3885 RepID=V7BQ09_PHAVU|nr:hypothetical protein PHAVU_006G097900g [Phaseolus vulgaris]ESW19118.1 hypothetical protein PHAVU_006G097900g [Phaseolus vulgaris]